MESVTRVTVATVVLLSLARPSVGQTSQPGSSPVRITETVVVTAGLSPIPGDLVARSLTLIDRRELVDLGLHSVADGLRLAPGVDVRARGPWGMQTDFSLRGATFGQSLVLVDGLRINDSQSGHHNGDIPATPLGLERIEVVVGGASAVHGADALAGTFNVITRRDRHAAAAVTAGQHGLLKIEGSTSGTAVPAGWTLMGWAGRSDGFTFDREFAQGGAALRGQPAPGWTLDLRHQRKAFGANGFYGPSPSKEWTDQTLAAVTWRRARDGWTGEVRSAYRNHGDHFRWDVRRPGFAENRHRTDAVEGQAVLHRDLATGGRLTLGGLMGGDWIRSSNLGDHAYGRGAVFAEVQRAITDRALVQAGLRFDGYATLGSSWSPSASIAAWLSDRARLRASAAHAFRVPTFTERYYTDPAHAARADLEPERGWSVDGGIDVTVGGWTLSASPFARWDRNVIDWVRAVETDRWRTTNVRDVTTGGVDLTTGTSWREAVVRLRYSELRVNAPELDQLSKYVKEYVPRSVGGSVSVPLGTRFRIGATVDYRRRLIGGQTDDYTVVGLRLSSPTGRLEWHVEAANALNETYREIAGVEMPGRWVTAGLTIR